MSLNFRRIWNRLTDRRREPPLIVFVTIASPLPFAIFLLDKPFVLGMIFIIIGLLSLTVFFYLSRVKRLNEARKA